METWKKIMIRFGLLNSEKMIKKIMSAFEQLDSVSRLVEAEVEKEEGKITKIDGRMEADKKLLVEVRNIKVDSIQSNIYSLVAKAQEMKNLSKVWNRMRKGEM